MNPYVTFQPRAFVKKWLIITEKQSVANDISQALKPKCGVFKKHEDYYENDIYEITWASGHLLELAQPEEIDPKYKAWLLQDLPIIPKPFQFVPKNRQKQRLDAICKRLKQAHIIGSINACDAGREGELIFRTILEYAGNQKPVKRLWLQSMTDEAIRDAFEHLIDNRELDPLGDAARCRIESDWLIGINLTRALTRRLKSKANGKTASWSIGRVQTPTLSMIVEREQKILAYQPHPYWTIQGVFELNGQQYEGDWFDPDFKSKESAQKILEKEYGIFIDENDFNRHRIFRETQFQSIWDQIQNTDAQTEVKDNVKIVEENPPLLYDLTTLQKEANNLYGFSSKKTLQAAQTLYEKDKMITYPRSDSRHLPADYPEACGQICQKIIDCFPELKSLKNKIKIQDQNKRVFDASKVSDHFAIIPTGVYHELTDDRKKIYLLIVKRFLEVFLPPAIWHKLERTTVYAGSYFLTKQSILHKEGWKAVQNLLGDKRKDIHPLTPCQISKYGRALSFNFKHALTPFPNRYTESKLLSLMENCGQLLEDENLAEAISDKGLGTPATRAEIIENLLSKEYLCRHNNTLFPTSKAMILIDVLKRIKLDHFTSPILTGVMESQLKEIEHNQRTRSNFMDYVIELTKELTEKCRSFQYENLYPSDPSAPWEETLYQYKARDGSWSLWKQKEGGFITPLLLRNLRSYKEIGPLDWLMRNGHTKKVFLQMPEDGQIIMTDEDRQPLEKHKSSDTEEVLEETIWTETFFGIPALIRVTNLAFYAQYEKAPKGVQNSRLPHVLCQRTMTLQDFQQLIQNGETPIFNDFISQKGKAFSAQLYLKKNGSFAFKFAKKEQN